MPKPGWTKKEIPSQDGKLCIVTGGTGGLGLETALGLVEAGGTVIIAARNEKKGEEALEQIKKACPEAKVSFEKVDLGSLASVNEFCQRFNSQHQQLDLLVNNAGVMTPPKRELTSDGFELQFGTNHLSHFSLTAQLLPALRRSPHPRVVNVSSLMHRQGKIKFDNLQSEKSYCAVSAYAQSKLANLLFTLELQRRSDEGRWGLMVNSAHPGIAKTDLIANGPGVSWLSKAGSALVSHSGADGALPTLFAATSPEAEPNGYYGPKGFYEMKGAPAPAHKTSSAEDAKTALKLWDISCTLTNVTWP